MSFTYNNIFNLECYIMFVDVCDKEFWLLSLFWDAVMGCGFSLQNRIPRQRFSHPVSVSSGKMLSSGLWIYEEDVLLVSMSNLKALNTISSLFSPEQERMWCSGTGIYILLPPQSVLDFMAAEMHSQERNNFLTSHLFTLFLTRLANSA